MYPEVIISAILSILTGLGGWYAARRKNVAEAQTNELDNVDKAVGIYREMAEDMGKRHLETLQELNALKREFSNLEQKVRALMEENKYLLEKLKKYENNKK